MSLDLSDILVRRLTWGHSKPAANLSLEQELVVRKNVQFGSLMLGESRRGCITDAAFQVLDSEHGREELKDVNSQDVRKLKDVNIVTMSSGLRHHMCLGDLLNAPMIDRTPPKQRLILPYLFTSPAAVLIE